MIQQAQDEATADEIEWITLNVAEPEARKVALEYRIRFVPTTIINGEKWLVGVTSVKQLMEEISQFK